MNEKIYTLAEQAGFENGHQDRYGNSMSSELEKLAELIVQECAEICEEMAAKCAGLPRDGALARDCAHWIRKDFGVKQ